MDHIIRRPIQNPITGPITCRARIHLSYYLLYVSYCPAYSAVFISRGPFGLRPARYSYRSYRACHKNAVYRTTTMGFFFRSSSNYVGFALLLLLLLLLSSSSPLRLITECCSRAVYGDVINARAVARPGATISSVSPLKNRRNVSFDVVTVPPGNPVNLADTSDSRYTCDSSRL